MSELWTVGAASMTTKRSRFTTMDQVVRAGVESIMDRDEAEKVWLDYAREKWSSGKESSVGGKAVEMDEAQFHAFLDESLAGAARP